jgi:hypothetical protein
LLIGKLDLQPRVSAPFHGSEVDDANENTVPVLVKADPFADQVVMSQLFDSQLREELTRIMCENEVKTLKQEEVQKTLKEADAAMNNSYLRESRSDNWAKEELKRLLTINRVFPVTVEGKAMGLRRHYRGNHANSGVAVSIVEAPTQSATPEPISDGPDCDEFSNEEVQDAAE